MNVGVVEVKDLDEARLSRCLMKFVKVLFLVGIYLTGSFNLVWANKVSFDIPLQSLDAALVSFAEKSGIQVVYKSEYTRGIISNKIRGVYEPSQALDKLIKGKALAYKFTAPDSLTLEKKIFGKTSLSLKPIEDDEGRDSIILTEKYDLLAENDTQNPKTKDSKIKGDIRGPVALPEINVFEKFYPGSPWSTEYKVENSATATKTNTPIIKTPVAIQVVPKSVFGDQQALSLEESLNNVSGVFPTQSTNLFESFSLRGFNTFDYYRDGVRFQSSSTQTGPRETGNLERIEVLKGPASILFGRIEPGGIINLVTKKPQETPYYSLQQQFGSYNLFRTALDATGSLNQDNSLLYRLNFVYEDKESFRDFVDSDHVFFAPVLQWRVSERTQITFDIEYKNGNSTPDYGFPALGDRPVSLPVNRNLGESFAIAEFEEALVGFNWSHAFNDMWTIKNSFNAQFTEEDDDVVLPLSIQADNRTLTRFFAGFRDNKTTTYTTNLDLTGDVEMFGVKHTVLIGGDYFDFAQRALLIDNFSFPSIDVFNPVNSGTPVKDPADDFLVDNDEEWFGIYFQDQIQLPHNIHLLAGFRYDNARIETNFSNSLGVTTTTVSEQSNVSPRFGLLWQPIKEVSFYGNYVENFGIPNVGNRGSNGDPLEAETAQQFEVGIKSELFDGRFSATLAWFQLTKQNIATADPDPVQAALGFFVQTGEAKNQGIELDITGEPLPGWSLIANYAYTDSEITKANNATQGNRFPNVPEHAGNIWTTYAFQNKPLKGLKLGGGLTLRGEREGNNENNFQMPGYTLLNLMTSYAMNVGKSRVTAQLNAKNLFDKEYFPSSSGFGRGRITVGTPRSFLGSIRVEY